MLIFSHKMVPVKNETALMCVTKQERARAFEATISVQRFDIAFVIKKSSFCGALFKHILAWKQGISKR